MTNDPRELVRNAIVDAARIRSIDAEAVAILLESNDTVTVDTADAAVVALLNDKPYLQKPPPNLGQGRDRGRTRKPGGIERGRWLHEEYTANGGRLLGGHHDYL